MLDDKPEGLFGVLEVSNQGDDFVGVSIRTQVTHRVQRNQLMDMQDRIVEVMGDQEFDTKGEIKRLIETAVISEKPYRMAKSA